MTSVLLGDAPDNVVAAYMIVVFAGYMLRKGADMHKTSKEGLSPIKNSPYLGTLFSLLAENEHML